MAICLGGRVAEEIIFGEDNSQQLEVASDIEQATKEQEQWL